MAILCIFIGMSCVSAEKLNCTDVGIGDINNMVPSDDTLEGIELNDFDELQNDMANLKPGDVYYFTRDYNFEFNDSDSSNRIIEIAADDVTIEGEHFKINGGGENNVMSVPNN